MAVITGNGIDKKLKGFAGEANSITGTAIDESITGGKFGDTINAGDGNDTVKGGAGDDSILGGNGNDKLYGGAGNDWILGGMGDDLIKGDAGDDTLNGAVGNDKLYGGKGNDLLYGFNDNDTLYGDAGDDTLYGGFGDDMLYGGAGNNIIAFENGHGNDTIYAGKGSDTLQFTDIDLSKIQLTSTDSKNVLLKYSDNDSIYINKYYSKNSIKNVILNGTQMTWEEFIAQYPIVITGSETGKIKGTKRNDYISAIGDLNDSITGGKGNDTIYGNAGNDTIKGGAGNDTIYGGAGDDVLYGDKGDDTFVFRKYDGNDTIYSGKGADTIKFEGDVGNISFSQGEGTNNKDLIINYGSGDSVTIKKFFVIKKGIIKGMKSSIKNITVGDKTYALTFGSDGVDSIAAGDGNSLIFAGLGDDVINPGAGNNILYFNRGDGHDVIFSGTGEDTLQINVMGSYEQEKVGNDLVIHYTAEDYITLKDFFNGDHSVKYIKLANWTVHENLIDNYINIYGSGEITGSQYTDNIYGSDGNDTITAGINTWGNDYVSPEQGNDVINVQANGNVYVSIGNGDGNDIIRGAANANSVTIYHWNSATIYGYQDGSNYIIVRKYTSGGQERTEQTVLENFVLADHPDIVQIEHGSSTTSLVAIDLGDGFNPATSTLYMLGDDTLFSDTSNDGLFVMGNKSSDNISTGSGNDVINAGSGNNVITSSGGNNKISSGDGNDTITTGAGNDTIYAGTGNNVITTSGGDNNIYTGRGYDSITVNGSGNNYIESGDGYDTITVNGTGNNNIVGGSERDKIILNAGHNTVTGGGGGDRIYVHDGENNIDISDGNWSYVTIYGGDSTIKGGNSNWIYLGEDSETLPDDTISLTGSTENENVVIYGGPQNTLALGGGNDNVDIYGGANNQVDLGEGNDDIDIYGASTSTIVGGAGSDTIYVSSDAGDANSVTIYGGDSISGNDTGCNNIEIHAGSAEIHAGNSGDYIAAYYTNTVGVSVFGGSGNDTMYGSYNADYLSGGAGNDIIHSYGGNDIIDAGAGDDVIYLDTGKETLIFNKAAGYNTVYDAYDGTVQDILDFSDSNLNELFVTVDGYNIIVRYNDGQSSVCLYNAFSNYYTADLRTTFSQVITKDHPEGISFETFINTRSVHDLSNANIYTPDTTTGGVYFCGTKLNDSIIGTENDDTIRGYYNYEANGNDTILGGAGNDEIKMCYGNNTIYGGTGNDYIDMTNFVEGAANTAIFESGDGMDSVSGLSDRAILKFDAASINNISISNIYEVYDEYGNGHVRTVIKYNGVETDGVIIDAEHLDYEMMQAQIGLTSGGGTQTIYDILNDRHIYLARSTNNRCLLNNLDEYSEAYISNNADYGDDTVNAPYLSTTDGNDYIYTAGWSSTIEGGKGDDTIEAIGRIGEDGRIGNVGYIDYVINIDSDGNGDGVDTILYDKNWGNNEIYVKGVGTGVDDVDAQQAFIDSLRCSFDGDDLIIEYGNDNSKLIFKNAKSDLSGISTSQFKFVYPETETGKYNLNNYTTYSGYWDLSSSLFIPVNMTSGTPYTASEYYSERINGTDGDDTITLGGQYKKVDIGAGADVIKIKSDENSGEYTINMGSDTIADTIWFEDITDRNCIRIEREYAYDENGNVMYDAEGNYIYTNDLIIRETQGWNARVILKDYFTYAQVENIPTFMQIKIGDGSESNTFNISDIYTHNSIYNTANLSTVNGSVFNDYIRTSNDVIEVVNAGAGNDTIVNHTSIWDDTLNVWVYPDPGADTINGGSGNDSITYTYHDNSGVVLIGGSGNDTIDFSAGTARGGQGSDDIYVTSVYNSNDYTSHYNDVTIYGHMYGDDADDDGTGNDTLRGGDGNDHIYGSKGNDSICGNSGEDYIDGGDGNDIIQGGSGLDTIYGNDGNDLILSQERPWNYEEYESIGGGAGYAYEIYYGSSGDAIMYGGDGDDTIIAQGVCHTIYGGEGNDLIVTAGYYDSSVNELHFSLGDGHDTVYGSIWSWSDKNNDTIIFDDIDLESDYIKAEFDEEHNQVVVYYDYHYDNVLDDYVFGSSITIKDYIRDSYINPADYTYLSHLHSSIDKITDQYGNVLSIRDMIEWNMGTVTTYEGTFFSDTATLSTSQNYFYGYYGSDSITGNDSNNRIFGYNESYAFGVEGDGDDSIDGGLGANAIYGGWGDDTLVGGGDDQIDTLYGGYGDNRYVINPVYNLEDTIAEIHSSSDQDTIALSSGVVTSYRKDGDDLLLNYYGPSVTGPDLDENTVILKDWYLNPRDFNIVIGNGWNSMYDLMASNNFSNGVEFGTTNTSSSKLYLGTSYDDTMNVAVGTTVSGGQGDDSILVKTSSSATIYGGLGNDTISVPDDMANTAGNLTIYGGEGTDSIRGGRGDDVIYTASPSEYYYGFDMEESLSYKDRVERYRTADSNEYDYVWTGAGNNTVFAIGENADIYGASGDDTYHLTLDNRINLKDISGSNNIVLHTFDDYEYAYIAIDLSVDLNSGIASLNSNGVMIMNEDAFYYWLDNHGNMNNYEGGYISLKDNTYSAINISGAHGSYNYMDSATIESFKNDIAGWLYDYGCSCVSDYMDENNFLREQFIAFNNHGGDGSGWQNID